MYSKRTKRNVSLKTMVILLVLVLLVGCAAGGTLAWLMTKSSTVTNTFVAGNIGTLNLAETKGDEYIVTPGVKITKDPVVTFTGNNVAAYVFLQIDATGWTVTGADTTYTYYIGENQEMSWVLDGWTQVTNGVYYKEVAANAGTQTWHVINGDTITVSSDITKSNISDYAKNLTFTAYAIQKEGFNSFADAWAQAKNATN